MPRAVLVTTVEALTAVVADLRRAPRVAVDTEGNGQHAYRVRLSAVQLCVADPDTPAAEVFVVDPLALATLAPLASLLGPDGPPLVIHDVAFDARLLATVGIVLGTVIDTSLCARYLALRETGLGNLLAARHGVRISKAMQQDDWARRPLSPDQLDYLADDVAYLGPLAAGLLRDVAAADITDEVAVETAYALASARAVAPDLPPYARIKGVRSLTRRTRAILREVALVREEAAARWDVPVGRVIANAALVQVARLRPRTLPEVRHVAGLYDRSAALAADLLMAIVRGERAGDVPEPERALFTVDPSGPREPRSRKVRTNALALWRQAESAARGVDPQVVLPGHALADIARVGPTSLADLEAIRGLGAARTRRYGAALLALLAEAAWSLRETPDDDAPVE